MSIETDFEFYMRFAKPLVLSLPDPQERALASVWIKKLSDKNTGSEQLRTSYLKLLLFVLQKKKLFGTFSEDPNQYDKLEEFPETNLKEIACQLLRDEEALKREQSYKKLLKSPTAFPKYNVEYSSDLLQYSASQDIPNFGVQAYYAISTEPLPNWRNAQQASCHQSTTSARAFKSQGISDIGVIPSEPVLNTHVPKSRDKTQTKSLFSSRCNPFSRFRKKTESKFCPKTPEKTFSNELCAYFANFAEDRSERINPCPLLGITTLPKEDRDPPTWGSNLFGVTDPPVKNNFNERLRLLKESFSTSSFEDDLDYLQPSTTYEMPTRLLSHYQTLPKVFEKEDEGIKTEEIATCTSKTCGFNLDDTTTSNIPYRVPIRPPESLKTSCTKRTADPMKPQLSNGSEKFTTAPEMASPVEHHPVSHKYIEERIEALNRMISEFEKRAIASCQDSFKEPPHLYTLPERPLPRSYFPGQAQRPVPHYSSNRDEEATLTETTSKKLLRNSSEVSLTPSRLPAPECECDRRNGVRLCTVKYVDSTNTLTDDMPYGTLEATAEFDEQILEECDLTNTNFQNYEAELEHQEYQEFETDTYKTNCYNCC